jgi:hypothetical protein
VSRFADGTDSDARLWEVEVVDGVEGVAVGETAVTEIAAGDSRRRKGSRGYAAGQNRLVRAEEPDFVLCGGSEGRVQDNLGQCFVGGEHRWDMDL